MQIPFNKPVIVKYSAHFEDALDKQLHGDGEYTRRCERLLERGFGYKHVLLVNSCTAALEIAALLTVEEGDEVIMPSWTFVSTANAFVRAGATPVFVDIRPDTLNIDEELLEEVYTKNTKAIVPVHYAGVPADMHRIKNFANGKGLYVIEDAAQAFASIYDSMFAGSMGHVGCLSFHGTKNITCGEGGALVINDSSLYDRARTIREKGTNRHEWVEGKVDKYSWVDIGSSYVMSELSAAFLYTQLQHWDKIHSVRMKMWRRYNDVIKQKLPPLCTSNGHFSYILKFNREDFIKRMAEHGIEVCAHYKPLHSSEMGKKVGKTPLSMENTEIASNYVVRFPTWNMADEEIDYVISCLKKELKHGHRNLSL